MSPSGAPLGGPSPRALDAVPDGAHPDDAGEVALLLETAAAHRAFMERLAASHAAFLEQGGAALRALRGERTPRSGPSDIDDLPPEGRSDAVRELVRKGRFAVGTRAAVAVGLALPGLLRPGSRIVATRDGRGVAEATAALLLAHGVRVEVVDEPPAEADVVLHLAGLRNAPTLESALEINFEGLRVVKTIAERFASRGGALVLAQDTGGDFGLSGSVRAGSSGLAALAKTAAWEWSEASVRAVDLELGGGDVTAAAERLVQELVAGGAETEVGLHADGRRVVPVTERRDPPAGELALGPDDVVLVTGGARGVTSSCVAALAARCRGRFALVGRTPWSDEPASCRGLHDRAALVQRLHADAVGRGETPSPRELDERVRALLALREVRSALRAIENAGGRARYVAVDILDPRALAAGLDAVRRDWGPFTGVIHAAGVNADRRIVDKDEAEARRVFDTKVRGLVNVLGATTRDPLSVICCFSSISGRWGNPGQVDYAMANEVAAKLLHRERSRRTSLRVCRVVDWGPWDGGMVTPALRARWEAAGVPVLSKAEGAERFCAELAGGPEVTEVVVGSEFATLSETGESTTVAEVRVSRREYPQVGSHVIEGAPVVPFALVHEWMVRLVGSNELSLPAVRCHDIQALRGVRLEQYDGPGDLLRLGARWEVAPGGCVRPGLEQRLALTLHDAAGTLRYRGRATSAREPNPSSRVPAAPVARLLGRSVYGPGGLFHGPMFQVMAEAACGDDGATCTLSGGLDVGWRGAAWRSDPAVIDGALQLAGVWSHELRGGAWLPTAVASIHVRHPGLQGGRLEAVLVGREIDRERSLADVWVTSSDGEVIAEVVGVTFHRYA